MGGPFEAVMGAIDELVVLQCLAGLLVHWVESSFGLRAVGPHEGITLERVPDAEV